MTMLPLGILPQDSMMSPLTRLMTGARKDKAEKQASSFIHQTKSEPWSESLTVVLCCSSQFYTCSLSLIDQVSFGSSRKRLHRSITLIILDIGNANIAGLTEDLHLSSSQYEWLLTSFYITYIAFQWMTLLYRVIPAHIYISLSVLSWSLTASLQAFANSFGAMVALRALLGIGEAAFSPGVPFLLSFFYKRDELALRTGLFISAAPLASSFASSLAWLIVKAGEGGPIAAWRLLFFIEGFPTVVFAVLALYQIPDSPKHVPYLTQRECKVARRRLQSDNVAGSKYVAVARASKLEWSEIYEALMDLKCWLTAVSHHLFPED